MRRKFMLIGAMAFGLMLGVILGPSLQSSIVSAQSPVVAQTQAQNSGLWSTFLDQLAAALKINRSALDSAIITAGTNTADAAVQQGKLTQAQADALKARIQNGDIGMLFGGPGRPGGPNGSQGGPQKDLGVQQAMFEAAAKALNLTTDELRTKLRDGDTLAELAQAAGTTEKAVTDAALAAAKAKLDAAVAAGTITQTQADQHYARLQALGAKLLNPGGPRPGGQGGPNRPGVQPTAEPTT